MLKYTHFNYLASSADLQFEFLVSHQQTSSVFHCASGDTFSLFLNSSHPNKQTAAPTLSMQAVIYLFFPNNLFIVFPAMKGTLQLLAVTGYHCYCWKKRLTKPTACYKMTRRPQIFLAIYLFLPVPSGWVMSVEADYAPFYTGIDCITKRVFVLYP